MKQDSTRGGAVNFDKQLREGKEVQAKEGTMQMMTRNDEGDWREVKKGVLRSSHFYDTAPW